MKCNCVKDDVCKYRSDLVRAFGNILEIRYGSMPPDWVRFGEMVRESCKWRKEEKS